MASVCTLAHLLRSPTKISFHGFISSSTSRTGLSNCPNQMRIGRVAMNQRWADALLCGGLSDPFDRMTFKPPRKKKEETSVFGGRTIG